MHGHMDVTMHGHMNVTMHGHMNVTMHGHMDVTMHGHMDVTMHGHMDVTMHGHMDVKSRLSLLLRYVHVKCTLKNFRNMFIGNVNYSQSRPEGNLRKYAGGGKLNHWREIRRVGSCGCNEDLTSLF
jgi:hypothetical protein